MTIHELAGEPPPPSALTNVPRLVASYYTLHPDPSQRSERVAFGTSGHRGTSLARSFNEDHVLAVTQAICELRREEGIDGPLFLGVDTHALSEPAFASAVEVLAAHGVELRIQTGREPVPTPVVSHAILVHNARTGVPRADGIVITPSHNPPADGGFKYNPPTGGPADTATTNRIQERANRLLEAGLEGLRRLRLEKALAAEGTREVDLIGPYVEDLGSALELDAIAASGLRLGADPLGGSSLPVWQRIVERFGLPIEIVEPRLDPTFSFVPLDHDGKIRMDCSSPWAMRGLVALRERFDVAFANDPDADRHGIVTRSAGLLNPNHYLAVAVDYLFRHRTDWPKTARVGKTLVSSSMIDRVARELGRELYEVPVGFKWFVDGLLSGGLGFGGEESAGASFLRRDGRVWTTDKDGILLGLLAAEITAVTGQDPGERYRTLEERLGSPVYRRIDAPATLEEKAVLKALSPDRVRATELAGEPIRSRLTRAPGNDAPLGGLKVTTENGWFAARPSGTEAIYKIYAESFRGEDHLDRIFVEARELVAQALATSG